MDDLLSFFYACLDDDERELEEDERVALEVPEGSRSWTTAGRWPETGPDSVKAGDQLIVEEADERDVQHIARWDPERVLRRVRDERADIAAKRRILDEFSHEGGETRAIMYLAQPLAGRPGWREEWQLNTQGDHS